MNQKTIEKISISGIMTSTVACLIWLFYSESWATIVNILQVYTIMFILQLQIVGILNRFVILPQKVEKDLEKSGQDQIYEGSLLDEVNTVDVDSVKFSTTPLSFQQVQMYLMIKSGEAQTRADGYVLVLGFLHARALDKNILFRNVPITLIPQLVDKAYKAAEQKPEITEFEDTNVFTDETT